MHIQCAFTYIHSCAHIHRKREIEEKERKREGKKRGGKERKGERRKGRERSINYKQKMIKIYNYKCY